MSTTLATDEQFLREVVVNSLYGLFAVDATGTVVFSNGVLEEALGVDTEAVVGTCLADVCVDERVVDRIHEAAATPGDGVELGLRDVDGNRVPLVATCERTEYEGDQYLTLWCQEHILGDRDDQGGVTASGPDTDETQRADSTGTGTGMGGPERVLDELTAVWSDLLAAADQEAVAEVGVDAVERFVETDAVCLRRFDDATGDFERVAMTDGASELLASYAAFDLHRTLAGRALRRGEPVLDRPDGSDAEDTLARVNLHVPLAEVGVLTVFGTGAGLGSRGVETVERLASVLAARLTQVGTDATGTTTDQETVALPMAGVVEDLLDSESREAVGRDVCTRLVEADLCDAAWFVTTDLEGAVRETEASAGVTDSPPAEVRQGTADADADDPVARAVDTGEVSLVRRRRTITDATGETTAVTPGTSERAETTVVVPVSHADRTYGVLVLQSPADETVDAAVRSKLAVLGDVVGLATDAIESRRLLLSENVQQLEFEVTDWNCLAVAVSGATDAFCEVDHQTLTSDGDHLCFLRVEGADTEAAVDATAAMESVRDCAVIETDDEDCLLEVTKTRSGAEALIDVGATVRCATAEHGTGTLLVEAPISADVREIVDAYTTLNPESELVAKRELERPVPTTETLRQRVDDVLTEKQRAVMTAAYYAGYFAWPRTMTAEEVADSLAISPATFHQHLRTAERKLLECLCDDPPSLHGT